VKSVRTLLSSCAVLAVLLSVAALRPTFGAPQPPPAPAPYLVLSKEGRQPLAVTMANGRDMVALDELARLFGFTVREDQVARGLVITDRGKTIVVSGAQGLASIGGRVVSLTSPPVRGAAGWLVSIDFIDRALALVHEPKLDVRQRSRLIVIGDLRVPRVAVRLDAQPTGAHLTFDIAPATAHGVQQEPGRLLVKFEADALDVDLPAFTASDLLQGLRVAPSGKEIALELGPRFNIFRAVDAPPEPGQARLTIDLLPASTLSSAAPGAAQPGQPGSQPGQPGQPGTPGAPPLLPPPPIFDTPTSAIQTIVLDPGHGGEKDGARGPAGSYEKHITLAVARQLKAALEARLGVRVLLTREDDRHVELEDRAAFANNNKADLFVSLHTNAFVRPTATGAAVFYLSVNDYSEEAKRLAIAENGRALPTISGGDRQIEMILWEMAQVQHIEKSASFAGVIEQELRARVKMSNRAIQQAPFIVLVGANMPAVLVEMGFISNPGEEKLLNSAAFQQQIVQGLVQSIIRFRDQLDGRRAPSGGALTPSSPPRYR
jgi:N-acetylmuramoyl-L-alanine amidase